MNNKFKNDKISFVKLGKRKRLKLIKARNFANKQALKYYGCQFSDSNEKNKELLCLFYTNPVHDTKLSKMLKLGLEYYSGLLLVQNLHFRSFWLYNRSGYRINFKLKIYLESFNPSLVGSWIVKEDFEKILEWHRNLRWSLLNHEDAVRRYRKLRNGKDPIWIDRKLYTCNPITYIPREEGLELIIDKYPNVSLSRFINGTKMLKSSLSDVYIEHVALYLNCSKNEPIGNLKANNLFVALYQCSRKKKPISGNE